jgi:hypothetical protein
MKKEYHNLGLKALPSFKSVFNIVFFELGFSALVNIKSIKGKAIPLHAMEALWGRGGIAPNHSRPRH